MNPMIATAAAGAATSIAQSDTTKKVIQVLLFAAGGFIVYKIGKKVLDNMRKNDTQSRAGEYPHVRVAMGLRSAINPSGVTWLKSTDGTNNAKMFEYAGQITNLSAVQSAYRDLYGGNLMDDVQKELNNTEYQKFMTLVTSNNNLVNLVNSGNTTLTAVKYAKPLELIVAKTNLNVRSSPNASYNGKVWEVLESNKNIIRSVKKGDFIGYATGRQEFDVKNNVKFIEVGFNLNANGLPSALKSAFGKFNGEVRQWVSSSAGYIDKFATTAQTLAAYPSLKSVLQYVKAPNIGLKGLPEAKPGVLSINQGSILNDLMQPVFNVNPNVLLGKCIMILKTLNGNELVKFRTVQGLERWIDKKHIKIIQL